MKNEGIFCSICETHCAVLFLCEIAVFCCYSIKMRQIIRMDDKLKLILEASAKLAEVRDLHTILITVTDLTKKLLAADRCALFLHDKKRSELWTIVAHGVSEIRVPDNAGAVGAAFHTRQIINIPDAYADSRFNPEVDKRTGYRTRNILAMPMLNLQDEIIGVFQVINKLTSDIFSPEDIDLARYLTAFAASNVENAYLYERLRLAQQDVVHRLSHATSYKDPETENHIVRVGLYCELMAQIMGFSPERAELVKLAAPMHDIGKVGIPDRILLKPGKLDADEWAFMQKHAQFGFEILREAESELLQVAALIALDHHEKWSGGGYPNGKIGADITVYGRMVALADVYDALTSKRPYKDAWSHEQAFELIATESGKHFDPKLAAIFIENADRIVELKRIYKD